MNEILKCQNLDISKLSIKKRINISSSFTNFPIKYNDNNLIVQTPIVYIPFGISCYNNKKYIDISLINCQNDENMKAFKKTILNIDSLVKSKFKKNTFSSSYKKTNFYPDRLRLSFYDDMLIFNDKKEQIDLSKLKPKLYVKLLISPQYVWKKSNLIGILWSILQVKIYSKPILNEYSFIDDEDDVDISKYTKMLKCRVPIQAIKNKMMLDKVDPKLLDKHMGIESSANVLNPPPPINLDIFKKKNLLKSLSKSKLNLSKKSESESKSKSNSNSFRVTLSDLKNIKLKKTSLKKEPVKFSHMNPFVNPESLLEMKNKILKR